VRKTREDIRNVAIIAHVDHGKTTLVDQLLRQSGTFRDNQVIRERVMDSGDLERERGITILSKNTSVSYKNVKINIVDTPGHADFGGEVERILKMVNGAILLVDAFEGPMPQTKFVLQNALAFNLPVIVCINKIDRPDERAKEVVDEVLELFIELGASDEQLDFPIVYASAKNGFAYANEMKNDMTDLFEAILKYIPAPVSDSDSLQLLISALDYNEYVGRIGIGKIESGALNVNDEVAIVNYHSPDTSRNVRITKLYTFEGLDKKETTCAEFGDIVAVSGLGDIKIGDTICDLNNPIPIVFNKISEPTISINFSANDSPFAGLEGKFVTSRHLRDRLFKELNTNVSLRVEETDSADVFKVSGRGELHLSILIETMRREGYEFQVSKPQVLFKQIDGQLNEPMEIVTADVPEEFSGSVISKLGIRKGEMISFEALRENYVRLKFSVPARGLIGYRNEFIKDTRGNGILNSIFDCYQPYKGDIISRSYGSLVAFETGTAVAYGLFNAQERGDLFVKPGDKVYTGMVVGRNNRLGDIEVNVCKKKQLTNMRASGSDDSLILTPALEFSLEQALDFINDDELIEITPKNFRIRKKILNAKARMRQK
jgi:GTP-binding protein TypA/BipA